jgi:hypothetical protein
LILLAEKSFDFVIPFRSRLVEVPKDAMEKKNIGSSFDSWLREEGIQDRVTAAAIKRVRARQSEAAMKEGGLTKKAMEERVNRKPVDLQR